MPEIIQSVRLRNRRHIRQVRFSPAERNADRRRYGLPEVQGEWIAWGVFIRTDGPGGASGFITICRAMQLVSL